MPAEIEAVETCATTDDDMESEFRVARVAERLLDLGVLASEDHGPTLDQTINSGMKRLLASEGCKQLGNALDHLTLRWTDDVVEAMELTGSCCEGAAGWWDEFGDKSSVYSMSRARLLSNGREIVEPPPLSAFAIRSSTHIILNLKDWYHALRYEMGTSTATEVVCVLSAGIEYIGGFDFQMYEQQIGEHWDDVYEDTDADGAPNDNEDRLSLDNFYAHVPKACCGSQFSVRKLRNARKRSIDATTRIREVVEAAHDLGTAVDKYGKAWEVIRNRAKENANCGKSEYWKHRFNQIGHFLQFTPPIALAWSGEYGDDPCLRLMDYEVEGIQCDEFSDVVWLQGFDIDKQDDSPGSLPFALAKLRQMARVIGLLDRLVTLLYVDAPATPPIRRGEPQRRRVRRNPALIENLDRLGTDNNNRDSGEMLCRL